MQSALDRKRRRILLRSNDLQFLKHELAHLYLDLRWRILPYSITEPFVLAMANLNRCTLSEAIAQNTRPLVDRWSARADLSACDNLLLLRDVLNSEADTRAALPLR